MGDCVEMGGVEEQQKGEGGCNDYVHYGGNTWEIVEWEGG